MRLVCPNCDAEYEVDDAAIPQTGRDVQCSNCGHAWFQAHPEALAEEAAALTEPAVQDGTAEEAAESSAGEEGAAEAVPDDMTAIAAVSAAVTPADAPEPAPPEAAISEVNVESEAPLAAPAGNEVGTVVRDSAAATRNIDESVLSVLREEAAREVAARRADVPAAALETQTEMRLMPGAGDVAGRVVARLRGEPEPAVAPQTPRPRRELLPAIEEINSTLRASSGRTGEADDTLVAAEAAQAARSSFGSGFLTLVLVAVILLALYVFAPLIGAQVPALAGVAGAYVAAVDAARLWLDTEMRSLIGMLRGLEGSSQG